VTRDWARPVDRAREDVRAARSLLESGFPSQAVSLAYSAGLQVAVAALAVLDERPSTDAGVVSAFGRRVVGDGGIDHEFGRTLRMLYEDRNDVENALLKAPKDEARNAIDGAERLVEAGARWLEEQRR
jgi:uncharacterized protein (UPF0332 family)